MSVFFAFLKTNKLTICCSLSLFYILYTFIIILIIKIINIILIFLSKYCQLIKKRFENR